MILLLYSGFQDMAMVPMINNISTSMAQSPWLTQYDPSISFCNANYRPANCNSTSPCICTHLVPLDLDTPYTFLLKNVGRMHCTFIKLLKLIKTAPQFIHIFFFSKFCSCQWPRKSSDTFAWV